MKLKNREAEVARRLKALTGEKTRPPRDLASRFAARLSEVASRPDSVPIRLCGAKLEARAGGTLLAAAVYALAAFIVQAIETRFVSQDSLQPKFSCKLAIEPCLI
jgi:hypothetical protein